MAQEHDGAGVDEGVAAGGRCNVDFVGSVQLQNMRLLVDTQHGSLVIPLTGHLFPRNGIISTPPEGSSSVTEEQGPGPATPAAGATATWNPNDLRGHLMTVAALFVGMAFQAGTQPPSWMPSLKDSIDVVFFHGKETHGGSITWAHARNALGYLLMNMVSFSIALTLVVVLPLISNETAARRIRHITIMLVLLAVAVASNFACGISDDALVVNLLLCAMFVYGLFVALVSSNSFRGLVGGLGNLPSWPSWTKPRQDSSMLPVTSPGLDDMALLEPRVVQEREEEDAAAL